MMSISLKANGRWSQTSDSTDLAWVHSPQFLRVKRVILQDCKSRQVARMAAEECRGELSRCTDQQRKIVFWRVGFDGSMLAGLTVRRAVCQALGRLCPIRLGQSGTLQAQVPRPRHLDAMRSFDFLRELPLPAATLSRVFVSSRAASFLSFRQQGDSRKEPDNPTATHDDRSITIPNIGNELPAMAQKCVHQGCGKVYTDADEVCRYHPGPPIFHEGQKGTSSGFYSPGQL